MIATILLLCGTIGLGHSRHPGHRTQDHRLSTNAPPSSWPEKHWAREFLPEEPSNQASSPLTSHQGELDDNYEAINQQPRHENWCSFVQSRLVTYVGVCTTEKYIIKSQQPCPHGTPDCQKIMYKAALKPTYQVKQKVLTSLHWKCCPGYSGKNCEHLEPDFFPVPTSKSGVWEEERKPLSSQTSSSPESRDILEAHQSHEALLEDLQNDVHQARSNLGVLEQVLHYNFSHPRAEVSHNQTGAQEQFFQQMLVSPLQSFLKEHFNPVWSGFNKSLQDLSTMVKNLSHNVEANRKSIEKFQESSVPKKDFQELGTKFESKIQENVWRADQMKREVDTHLHLQQAAMHYNLTTIKAETDMKLKRYHKIQNSYLLALNSSITDMRQEQDKLHNELETLARNLAVFPVQYSKLNEEAAKTDIQILNQTLAGHARELKELYEESDEFYDDFNKLRNSINVFKASLTNQLKELRVALIEKSLIIEEYKGDLERKILALNDTLENIRESHWDLERSMKACHCVKLPSDTDVEEQANVSRAIREEMKQFEAHLKALKNEIDDLATAFRLFHQPLDFQQKQSRELEGEVSLLKAQGEALSEGLGALEKTDERMQGQIKYLNSSFNSLLVDAMRHETALEALLGEEVMELLTEEDPRSLISSLDQLQEHFRLISDQLEKQNITIESVMKRMYSLEMDHENASNGYKPLMYPILEKQMDNPVEEVQHVGVEHMEPNHEATREDMRDNSAYHDIMTLKKEIGHLTREMKKHELQRDRANLCCNHTAVNLMNPFNVSLENLREELASTQQTFGEHLQIFQKLFGSNQELAATNISLDVAKIQLLMGRQMKKQLKVQERQKMRDKNEANQHREGTLNGRNKIQKEIQEADSSVAFYVKYPEGREGLSFNKTYLNYGEGYFPEHGYFKSPHNGVYMVAITMEFIPGTALGQLVFSNGHRTTVLGNKNRKGHGGTMTAFALVELKKGEHMWFELLQGSVVTQNPAGMSMAGFLIFRT
ncbi:multimerin-2 [Eublepharis macularius]|uniref:Multimerin-2 n=1 Tax=Eublepharis macularius TaxID=481883 RepID=A0AA97L2Q4_EUBMA|nr:multimerin-2 [Eublepharis macularius]